MPDIPEDIKALEEKIEALKTQKVQAEKRKINIPNFPVWQPGCVWAWSWPQERLSGQRWDMSWTKYLTLSS